MSLCLVDSPLRRHLVCLLALEYTYVGLAMFCTIVHGNWNRGIYYLGQEVTIHDHDTSSVQDEHLERQNYASSRSIDDCGPYFMDVLRLAQKDEFAVRQIRQFLSERRRELVAAFQ